jgi:hypothetical protein
MSVAITFCDKTEHECRKDKHDDSFFHRSEAECLPRLIQFGVPLQFLACSFCRDRTISMTHNGGSQQEATACKTLPISKCGEFLFHCTERPLLGNIAGLDEKSSWNSPIN